MDKQGAVCGFILGDALGVPYEFKESGTFNCKGMVGGGTHGQPCGTWSDDTSLLLATCFSLKRKNGFNKTHLFSCYKIWYDKGVFAIGDNLFDIGNITARAISEQQPQCGKYDAGCACLPIAFGSWLNNINDTRCVEVLFGSKDSISTSLKYIELLNNCEKNYFIGRKNTNDGYCVDVLDVAIWCFNNSNSYKETVLKAVNLGGDTDSVAAIAGSLAGGYYGLDNIPKEWWNKVRDKKLINACI